MAESTSLKRATFQVTLAVLISRVTGFLRELALAWAYGLSGIRDAYNISQYIPNQLGSLLNASTSAGLIPLFMKIKREDGEEAAWNAANAILGTSAMVLGLFSLLLSLLPQPFVVAFAPGFMQEGGERFSLAVYFLRFTAFSTLFLVMNGMLTGLSQAYKDFVPYMVSAPLQNLTILAFIFLAYYLVPGKAVFMLALGTFAGALVFVIIPFARVASRYKGFLRLKVDFKNRYVQEFLLLSIPVLIGSSVQYINILVDQIMASFLPVGSISALNYGNQIMLMMVGIFGASIASANYPYIIEDYHSKNYTSLTTRVHRAFNLVQAIMVPSALGLLVLGVPLARLLFQRGNFTAMDAQITGRLISAYGVGLLTAGLSVFYPRLYYATGDTTTPTKIATAGVVLNVALNYLLAFALRMGALGMAIATSVTITFNVALYHRYLRGKIPNLTIRPCLVPLLKAAAAAAIMATITTALSVLLPQKTRIRCSTY